MPNPNAESSDPWKRVSAVVVTHDSAAVIEACLKSIARANQVIVVDNASHDGTLDLVAAASPQAVILKTDENVGFGAGANEGVKHASGEFALLINPDATLEDAAIAKLVAAADRYPDAAILAPLLLDPNGFVHRSHNESLFTREEMPRRRIDRVPEGDICAGFLSGALMLLRKRAFDAVGGFDPEIFLYYEDDDLCLRLRQAGWSLVLVAEAQARHVGGASAPWSLESHWQGSWHMGWSRLYLERKHRGGKAMRKIALRALPRHAGKIIVNLVRFDRRKLVRDLARFCGTLGYLLGLKGRGF